ncbi:hypothetical protein SAMN04488053_1224 [Alkalicoccus daliensis]|uniref:Uncharacterized protein n=1 Tax=Alkalicoccus daliensis TaxID=745820 RepID=A0A1H0L052_9BACI|nr:hypothetical protein SAMN04488053_1224 [Alkalicoccus daliensis]
MPPPEYFPGDFLCLQKGGRVRRSWYTIDESEYNDSCSNDYGLKLFSLRFFCAEKSRHNNHFRYLIKKFQKKLKNTVAIQIHCYIISFININCYKTVKKLHQVICTNVKEVFYGRVYVHQFFIYEKRTETVS